MIEPVMRAHHLILNFRNHYEAATEGSRANAEKDERDRERESELRKEGNCRKKDTARGYAVWRFVVLTPVVVRLSNAPLVKLAEAFFGHCFRQIPTDKTMRLFRPARGDALANSLLASRGKSANALNTRLLPFRKRLDADANQTRDQNHFHNCRFQEDDRREGKNDEDSLPAFA